ncbi:MAG: hypothetical protein K2X27_08085 [Candidatus Obscuribacterales bacterium]|nr:hypothetical protein [Candidatus Obscuribacterales bacterium]
MKSTFALATLSLALSLSLPTLKARAATERAQILGNSHHLSKPLYTQESLNSSKLSYTAMQLAEQLGMMPDMERLQNLREQNNDQIPQTLEALLIRQNLSETMQNTTLELRTVVARVDREIASANEIHAHLAERRDRAVRLNTYADFISGGVTGIVSGSMKLGDVTHFAPDVIDTVEGVVQSGLSCWALSQQKGERRMEQGIPSILAHLINQSKSAENDYPHSTWTYLNLPANGSSGPSALKQLVDRWFSLDLCLRHTGHRGSKDKRQQSLSSGKLKLTIDILEDRLAMLTDLRSCLLQMDYVNLELLQFIRGKKSLAG